MSSTSTCNKQQQTPEPTGSGGFDMEDLSLALVIYNPQGMELVELSDSEEESESDTDSEGLNPPAMLVANQERLARCRKDIASIRNMLRPRVHPLSPEAIAGLEGKLQVLISTRNALVKNQREIKALILMS